MQSQVFTSVLNWVQSKYFSVISWVWHLIQRKAFENSRNLSIKEPKGFDYLPLQEGNEEIRILKLLPGNFEDDVQVEILHYPSTAPKVYEGGRLRRADLQKTLPGGWTVRETVERRFIFCPDSGSKPTWTHPVRDVCPSLYEAPGEEHYWEANPAYEALSYVWGPQISTDTVTVIPTGSTSIGCERLDKIEIGENLSLALRHLRSQQKMRMLWIDALCINQDDFTERHSQIQRMERIYSSACRTVIWLGPENHSSKLAMDTLSYLGEQVEATLDGHLVCSPEAQETGWHNEEAQLPYTPEIWDAIHNLLSNPWFERLWVIQEIRLANPFASLQYGSSIVPWYLIRRAVTCLYSKNILPRTGLRQLLLKAVWLAEDHRGKPLTLLLEHSRHQKCLDPKDRVYGLMGILPRSIAACIRPNYAPSSPVAETFKNAFLAHMNHVKRWELFSAELSQRIIGGPSWVPDWSAPVPSNLWGSRQQLSSGHSRLHFTYQEPNTLLVMGIQAAVVIEVKEPVVSGIPETDVQIVRSWEPEGLAEKSYVTGDSLLDSYSITLLQNRTKDRWPRNNFPEQKHWALQTQPPALFGPKLSSSDPSEVFGSNFTSNRAYNCVLGRAYITTKEGYIGLGPTGTRVGDIICTFLGCDQPLILRPRQDGTYQLVGYCFVYGLNDNATFLGPLSRPWRVQVLRHPENRFREIYHFFNEETGDSTPEDPRLSGHPEWERINLETAGKVSDPSDPIICDYFKNKVTGETMESDPRLLPHALAPLVQRQGRALRIFSII